MAKASGNWTRREVFDCDGDENCENNYRIIGLPECCGTVKIWCSVTQSYIVHNSHQCLQHTGPQEVQLEGDPCP
jgi:hypothetical protein